jgi:hypothetical protein
LPARLGFAGVIAFGGHEIAGLSWRRGSGTIAFSGDLGIGWRKESASKQQSKARSCLDQNQGGFRPQKAVMGQRFGWISRAGVTGGPAAFASEAESVSREENASGKPEAWFCSDQNRVGLNWPSPCRSRPLSRARSRVRPRYCGRDAWQHKGPRRRPRSDRPVVGCRRVAYSPPRR